MSKWQPISKAPKDGTYIVLLMDSGYTTTPYILKIAAYEKSYKGKHRWRDHANDSVFDSSDEIIAWRKWVVPIIKFSPDEGMYIYLKEGEKIIPGDKMQRKDDTYVRLTGSDIDSWEKVTGKKLIYEKGDLPVKREI